MGLDLWETSVAIIRRHQSPSGALIASPTFPTYAYCWLRDGSFIAHGLDRAGEHAAAAAFHHWAARTVLTHRHRAEASIRRAHAGLLPAPGETLHCRYTLDGQEGDDGWPNHQIDGYGTWLWALRDHLDRTGDTALAAELRPAVQLVTEYLVAMWPFRCHDCWEESGDRLHPATLACVYGGLMAAAEGLGEPSAAPAAARVAQTVLRRGVRDGRLVKHLDGDGVDASLLWCSTPFRLLAPDDPIMVATVAEIERTCVDPGGGVHRYPGDSYYGGGAWLLLTAWLGWYYQETGRTAAARSCQRWVETKARPGGEMPEQVAEHLYDPGQLPVWEQRWGKIANPLLWSHAMHLVLRAELAATERSEEPDLEGRDLA